MNVSTVIISHGDGLSIGDMHRDRSRFPDFWVGTARPDMLLKQQYGHPVSYFVIIIIFLVLVAVGRDLI